ncbi:MAG TPA: hypothetical protein VH135_04035, partial [Steroidobacteraceae bacterium]|nr:hypothetical protein [Steroidobacteraceae bacterium]
MPAAVVAAVVVLAGARLITLSTRDHAADLRSTAQGAAAHQAQLIEVQLQALLERARGEARRAAGVSDERGSPAAPLTAVPGRNAFWTAGTGVVLRTEDADPAISRALASEWVAAQARGRTAAGLFGPVRYGSQWLVAAQTPIDLPRAAPAAVGARAFAYESTDELLLGAGIQRLAREGYDFELSQDA